MKERVKRLEADVQQCQEEALERVAKKARHEKPCTLKKKSHQIQHDFNKRVVECLETATKPVSGTTMTKIMKVLEEGMEVLSDELASCSEDEKKIERTAERKAPKKRRSMTRSQAAEIFRNVGPDYLRSCSCTMEQEPPPSQ